MEVSDALVETELRNCEKAAQRREVREFIGEANFHPHSSAPTCSPVKGSYALVNFVFQGGGLLGIAHLGFLSALEHVGVRAVGLAGTSAGAILALLAACARRNDCIRPVANELVPILWKMPASSFIDGPYGSRRLVKHVIGGGGRFSFVEMSMPILTAARRVMRTFGLNRGVEFEDWLSGVLVRRFGVETMQDLEDDMLGVARSLGLRANMDELLKIFATALPISTSSAIPVAVKFTFPAQLDVISSNPGALPPARMARASMSIPLFFDPVVSDLEDGPWRKAVAYWFNSTMLGSVREELCKCRQVAFVDGGLLSNFPIDSFSNVGGGGTPGDGVRSLRSISTIGVTLTSQHKAKESVPREGPRAIGNYVGALLDGMRSMRDREALALAENIDAVKKYSNLRIAAMDVGDHNWLNFQLKDDERADLFLRGVRGAAQFLLDIK